MRLKAFFVYIGVISAVVTGITWSRLERNSLAVSSPPTTVAGDESVTIRKLNSLLEGSDVTVEDRVLLPAQVDGSRTLHVRIMSVEAIDLSDHLPITGEFSLLSTKNNHAGIARQRALELSPTLVLVVAVDNLKQVLWWNLQPDPRVFRADTVTADGQVMGKTLYRTDADMLVSIPADGAITHLHFYRPVWDGKSSYGIVRIGRLEVNDQTEVDR